MKNFFFLIFVAACLLAVLPAAMPVSALPVGNLSQAIVPAAVTISASQPAAGAYNFGDEILFSGTNTDSNTTYIFFTGPDLNDLTGSQIDSPDPRISPVFDGRTFSFKAVPVGTDHHWSWRWDTHEVPLNTGTYTIYAVSTPRDKRHLETAIYDSMELNMTEPLLTAVARPQAATGGQRITISGVTTGRPGPGIAIWVIGPEYSARSVVMPDSDGSYSLDIDSSAIHLLPGTYHVFVEHPSSDDTFDFDLNGDYLFNNKIRSNIFTFQGNGRLYGETAYTAFSAAVNGPKTDDLIVPASFTLGTPAATTIARNTTIPEVNATLLSGNGTVVPGPGAVPAGTGQPQETGGIATPGPGDTVTEVPGNATGNDTGNATGIASPPPGTTGGDLPYGLLAGIAGIVVIAAAAGAILFTRSRRTGTVTDSSPEKGLPIPGQEEGPGLIKGTGTAGPDTAVTATATAGMPPSTEPAATAFPKELAGKYTDISPIGSGGFAMVYSAHRIADNEKVAVKIPLRSNERTGKSFLHEINVWETMDHPNIVAVRTANILPVPYVEMEYVPGSLENMKKPVPVVTAARIVKGITEGIRYAHARRCIHRDIKPQNILLTDDMVPKITDWGISKVLEDSTRKTTVAGFSLAYAAPEQIAPETFGSTDERTDIYQIGAVFYELVLGLTPFDDESMMEMVSQITTEDPLLPSDISPETAGVEPIILKCLAKNKEQRYQSAGELLDALSEYLDTVDWNPFEEEP